MAYERDLILDALKTTRQPRQSARLLDTTERILNYKVRGYGIDARRFRVSDGQPAAGPHRRGSPRTATRSSRAP